MPPMLDELFWSHVDRSGGPNACWPWTAAKNEHGYGIVRRARRNHRAHRWAWYITTGELLHPDVKLLHRCDNPPCVNPAHTQPGTQTANIADCVAKQRNKRGVNDSRHKLAEDDVRAIRHLAGSAPQRVIAQQFGITQSRVSAIVNNKGWRHVPQEVGA